VTLPALIDQDYDADLRDINDLDRDLERTRLLGNLHAFLVAAWDILEPTVPFVDNWHVQEICTILQDIATGRNEGQRFIFNVPPGTLKSILISVVFPAWVWARDANKKFLSASYGSHLTVRDNLRVRDIIESKWFQRLFPIKLVDDQNTKTRYNTDQRGWRIATSVGGVGTGEHPDFIIIDDPTTAAQAQSEPERNTANAWFDRTISSRGMARHVVVIVVMQRLHEDDLTGHLVKRGGVQRVCFPMRYEKCTCVGDPATLPDESRCALHRADVGWQPDARDHRTEPGELLFPALFPESKVKQLELDLGPYDSAGQLQQRPSPEGGGLFQRGWFKFLDVMPKAITRKARGWDTAGTEGGGDYTAGVKIEEDDLERFIVSDVQRDQLGPAGVDALIKATAELDGKECAQREEKEGGSAGKTVVEARAKMLKGFDYQGVNISGSKVTRAKPFRSQCEAGNVYLLRAPWNEEYIRELCNFPGGKNDDMVDGSSASFNAILLEPKKRKMSAVW
jgi:predicted phage terminase large subunit-like protein